MGIISIRKTIRNIGIGALIGISIGLSYLMSPGIQRNYRAEKINPSASRSVVECVFDNPKPQNIQELGYAIENFSKDELVEAHVDISEKPSPEQLEQIINNSLPYIASVLGHSRIHNPKLSLVDKLSKDKAKGEYNEQFDYIRLKNSVILGDLKYAVPHEFIHAQYAGGNILETINHVFLNGFSWLTGINSKFSDGIFVSVTTEEVLARQALDGDKLAEYAFGKLMSDYFSAFNKPDIEDPPEFAKSAKIILDNLSCKIDEYRGIRLYGIRGLAQNENYKFSNFFHLTIK